MEEAINPQASFDRLKANVVSSIQSHFPFEGRRRKVVLNKIWVDDNLDVNDISSQTEARVNGRTWGVPVKGDISLIDKTTGKVIDRKVTTLARLPKMTRRYGYIVDGNEYQVDHLFRLKSGVYARVQNNGDLESEFNLAKSPFGNRSLGIHVDRSTKKISLLKDDAHISIYPVMKAAGIADDQLEKEWGKDILQANLPKKPEHFERELRKFWEKTAPDGAAPPKDLAGLVKHVHDVFDQTELLPETTAITLGKPFKKVNGEVLHRATAKLLAVARGDAEQDDRDSLAFKEVVAIDDFIPEKIEAAARKTIRTVRNTVDYKDSVGEIITGNLFGRPVKEFFTKGSSVVERTDQTNPVQMLSAHRKTTLMAPAYGGIKNENAITNEMRGINPSHFGFLDPMKTPESEKTGVSVNLSLQARKNGRKLELPVFNTKTGKSEYLDAISFDRAIAVLPDQVRWVRGKPEPIGPMVKVKLPGGSIETRPWKEATYVMPSAKGMFDVTSNLIPFLPCDQGNRVSFADKQMEQAIALKSREAPLVQSKSEHPKDAEHTFEKAFGAYSSHRSPVDGKVVSVTPDKIVVEDASKKKHFIHLYNHFPLNESKGVMHSDPLVKVGDQVKRGHLVADTNYTRGGALAIGTNLRVGYIPYKGYNFEDGIVISESAAKKLTSDHMYKLELAIDPEKDIISKGKFLAHAQHKAATIGREAIDALDEHGIIRVGTKVKPGQVLVAAVGENTDKKAGVTASSYGARAFKPFRDKSLIWDEDHVGTVVRVVKDPNGKSVKVHVRTEEPAVIGDKLSGRHGNKGIITQILPDHEMPHTVDPKTGEKKHLEVLLNPSGVPTRINVGQIMETAAAKIAEKTGKPYIVDNFAGPNHDYRKQVEEDLKKHGISDEELVFDPSDPKKPLGSVLVGPQYLMKLKHQVEKKLVVRGAGTTVDMKPLKYDTDRQPTKGSSTGGQGFGQLEVYSLLAHDARHNLREMATYKSDKQDTQFWTRIQEGFEPQAPDTPFAYKKFVGLLQGLGVDVKKNGSMVQLLPMTDQRILELAGGKGGEVKNPHLILRGKDLKPEKGGLFDPDITGGKEGTKWSYMKLHEPMPNPIFMGQKSKPGPIPALLNMSRDDVEAVITGQKELHGLTGGRAIQEALKKVNVEKEITDLKARMPHLKGSDLDRANRKLKYLAALKEHGLKPHEAYVLNYVPIVPPVFRPVSETPTGDIHKSPLNDLYKNIAITNNELKTFDPKIHHEGLMRSPLRKELWEGLQALQAVGGAVGYNTDSTGGRRKLKGILAIIGNEPGEEQPKEGYFQSRLIKKRQDLSIRSTIIPEPRLGLDEVGLPRSAAMELYRPFVVAELVKRNFTPLDAQMEVKKADPTNPNSPAFRALEKVLEDRPLLLKRDPALHKFSVMAFKPVLHDGKAIKIHPLVCGGFNADFDGDTMAGTVPVSKEAIEEARKMFPSRNLFSSTNFEVMYAPTQESMLGLHLLTKWGKPTGKSFKDPIELNRAVERGEVKHDDVVKVGGKETTFGRLLVNSRLPKGFAYTPSILYDPKFVIDKSKMFEIATHLAKNHERDFGKSINDLKDLGNDHSFKAGFSFGLKDLAPIPGRDQIIAKADREAEQLRRSIKDKDKLYEALVGNNGVYTRATKELDTLAQEHFKRTGEQNRLMTMVYSGARGKKEQLRQMVAAPMLLQDSTNRTVMTPVKKSYAEGLDIGDYWISQHGARKGTLQRAQGTSLPGSLTKDIINTTIPILVTSQDCGAKDGVHVDVATDKDIHDRFLAVPYKLKNGQTLKPGTLVTPEILTALRNSKHDKIVIRSPLKCQQSEGICAKCFGLNESGKLHTIGTNVGVLAGQALGEPATQMAMDAFHSGGIAGNRGAASVDRFTRLRQLLDMPEKLKNQATIARVAGPITAIRKDPSTGGVEVFISGQRHYVPRELVDESLKVGQEVKKGQSLSHHTAPINPHHLFEVTRDIHSVQNYLTKEIHKSYEKEGVRKRNVEVVVRGMTNLTKIKDPGSSHWNHGDVVSRSVIEEHNRKLKKGDRPVLHDPQLVGVKQVTLTGSEDWMARLNYIGLHGTIIEGAAKSWKSNIHGSHPVPGLAFGKEFGKPPTGAKKHYY